MKRMIFLLAGFLAMPLVTSAVTYSDKCKAIYWQILDGKLSKQQFELFLSLSSATRNKDVKSARKALVEGLSPDIFECYIALRRAEPFDSEEKKKIHNDFLDELEAMYNSFKEVKQQ